MNCPSQTHWLASVSAGEYAQLASVLAGFAFTAIVFTLQRNVDEAGVARAVSMLIYAFFSLVLTSVNYSIMAGEDSKYSGGRVVSEGIFSGVALAIAGLMLVYAIILLLDATDTARRDKDPDCEATAFGRVARQLRAITAVLIIPLLVFLAGPTAAQGYADATQDHGFGLAAWIALGAQVILSLLIVVAIWRAREIVGTFGGHAATPLRLLRRAAKALFKAARRGRTPILRDTEFVFSVAGLVIATAATVATQVVGAGGKCDQASATFLTMAVICEGLLRVMASLGTSVMA